MLSLAKMRRKLTVFSMITATVTIVLVAIIASPEFIGLAGATAAPLPSQATAAGTETCLVYEFSPPFALEKVKQPDGTLLDNYYASFTAVPSPTARRIWLIGCWLIDPTTGNLVADLIAQDLGPAVILSPARYGGNAIQPNIILGDWSASPFWLAKSTPAPVVRGASSATIDWTTGKISFGPTPPSGTVYVKFSVKQSGIHSCGQLPNL